LRESGDDSFLLDSLDDSFLPESPVDGAAAAVDADPADDSDDELLFELLLLEPLLPPESDPDFFA
jgi:hypothetical protein